jgi:hypothetical protein
VIDFTAEDKLLTNIDEPKFAQKSKIKANFLLRIVIDINKLSQVSFDVENR